MKRLLFGSVMVAWLALLLGSLAQAQDKVFYHDPAKKTKAPVEQPGTIKSESPKEIVIKPQIGADKIIPTNQIVDVIYIDQVKGPDKATYRKAEEAEHKAATDPKAKADAKQKALTDALGLYQQVLANNKSATPTAVQRHLEYKIGALSARLAGDDKKKQEEAAGLLAKFKNAYPKSWQIVNCTRSLADLYVQLGESEKAAAAFTDLQSFPGISEESKTELELKAIENLIKADKTEPAGKRIREILTKLPRTNPHYERLSTTRIVIDARTPGKFKEAVAELEKMIETSKDNGRIALAYNTLGECYLLNKEPREAMWHFLRVDLQYYQDKNEHQRAVAALAKVFKELRQPEKAKDYEMKLERLKKG